MSKININNYDLVKQSKMNNKRIFTWKFESLNSFEFVFSEISKSFQVQITTILEILIDALLAHDMNKVNICILSINKEIDFLKKIFNEILENLVIQEFIR